MCEHCSRESGMQELLGTVEGKPVYAPLALRNVVGREKGLWRLECGHMVLCLSFTSAQEHLDDAGVSELVGVRGHFPTLGRVR